MRAWVGSWTECAGRAGARPGACSPTTWRRASSGPRRRASRGRNARAAGTALAVSLGDAFPPGSLLRPGGLMACADACGHAEPDTVRAPQPSQATTARLARRSASPASRGGTRACPSSATSPATRPAPPPPLAPSPSPGDRKGYAYLRLGSVMRRSPGRDATRRAAEGGPSGAEAHGPVAPGACLRSPAPGGWPGGSGSPLPRPRPRREGLRDRQAGRQGPARLRPDGGDPRGAPARVPRGHCGGQDDVGRAGLAQDLARGRVDARGPARATRDRARRAAGHHRARAEDERGARGLRDQVPGHHQAASCEPRKCRELRLTPSWARTLATATAISAS